MTAATQLHRPAAAWGSRIVPADERATPAGQSGAGRVSVAVQGPGGTGKTVLLQELAAEYRRAGRTVLDAGRAPEPERLDGQIAVLVDDAHQLAPDAIGRMRRLLDHPGVRMAVAFRPWPRPAPLLELLDRLGGDRRLVLLGHADASTVHGWARARLGAAATPALVDVVLTETGGLPALVHPFLDAVAEDARPAGVPRPVLARVGADLAALDDDIRALLHAVATGAPTEAELLGEVLDLSLAEGAELIRRARATGFLLPSGAVVPVVARALLQSAPADVTRSVRRRLLGLLLDRGDEPLELARAVAADGVRDRRAAGLLAASGSAALVTDPGLAAVLMREAVACGASAAGLATRRAEAAALAGDLDGALQLADTVLSDPESTDRPRAAAVTAAILARRGLPARSGELYGAAGPAHAGSRALALLATGDPAGAVAVLENARSAPVRALPTMLSGSEELMAEGVLQSLRAGPDAGGDIAAALSTLTRAATLLEPVGRTAVLADTPAALAALVALHSGELTVAESVLRRAIETDSGARPSRPRHLLLLAWAGMLRGQDARARELALRAREEARCGLEPRDDLFAQALEVGLARRRSDVPALVAAWVRAREAVLRHPVDLFALLPLGELVVAAARLDDAARLAPHVAAAQGLLSRLGEPPLWAAPLHWSGAQAAILTGDPEALRPHATALAAASRSTPYAATLARAVGCWLEVLGGAVDAGSVMAAADRLAAVGLAWDGSRLAGQAAVRTPDPRARTELLGCARALAEAYGTAPATGSRPAPPDPASAPAPGRGQLSDREREVARLVLAGQTYREIGGRLFISAKTVEHHVSRIRHRLGAGNRSDLLVRLRMELAEGA